VSTSDRDPDAARRHGSPGASGEAYPPEHAGDGSLRAAERERDAAQESRDRFAFLAEVSRCLADSLDYETTLTTVAGMSLPYLGAWCIVDVLAEDGQIRRLAVLHPDPAKQAIARELHERYPPQSEDLIGAPRVIRSGRAELVFDVPDAALAATARDAEQLRLLRALGTRSYVIVPMMARGRILGAITFVTADETRRFGDLDVVIAEDLARRAAMAVDNARLYGEAEEARRQAEEAWAEAEAAMEEAREALAEVQTARDGAERALAARDHFLSTMSHELRTPVNAMIGYSQLLQLGVAGPVTEQQGDYLARLAATSEHLRGLVDDVLDLARLDAGWMTVETESAMTGGLVATALDLVRPQASARGIRLVDLRAGEPGEPFAGDSHRVRQILANLLSNAVKFTPAGGTVTLDCGRVDGPPPDTELRGTGPWTYIRVADTGIGIPLEEQTRVFEHFYQVQNSRTRQVGGTGLGLSISRRLARLMGGDLTLQSEPGEGATFTLWLPAGLAGVAQELATVVVEDAARARQEPVPPPRMVGLAEVGARLRRRVEEVIAAFARRLRGDPTIPVAAQLKRAELEDHQLSFLADVAQTLVVLEDMGGAESDLLRDGSTIQRVIAELHGTMRQARGWTEAQFDREYDILGAELAAAVHRGGSEGEGDASFALEVLGRLMERARGHGRAALRRAAEGARRDEA
jgi:signal transduction histidine kinase